MGFEVTGMPPKCAKCLDEKQKEVATQPECLKKPRTEMEATLNQPCKTAEDTSGATSDVLPCPSNVPPCNDNLYCFQWVNIIHGRAERTQIYRIVRGLSARELHMHDTNPVRLPIVAVWDNLGIMESVVHEAFRNRRVSLGGSTEWFDFSKDTEPNIVRLVEDAIHTYVGRCRHPK